MTALAFESRRLGWPALVAPLFAVLALCFFGLLSQVIGAPAQTDRVLSAIVQVGSMVGGIAAVSAVASDPAIELRLSLPRSVRRSVLLRLLLALLWSSAVIGFATELLHELGRLTSEIPDAPLADQLEWLPPLLLLAGVGALTAVATRAATAGAGVVAAAWVLSNLLSQLWSSVTWLTPLWIALPFDPADPARWYWNRITVALVGMACLAITAVLLGRPEHLLAAER
ncbi:MAG TPA: hypothetical protein VEU77_02595 [Candidatus Acidoferrales bacterium]|nr:hypothetical protein [Candidatus Acidoferrales bacterium]